MGYSVVFTVAALVCAWTVAYGVYIGKKIDSAK